LIQLKAVTGGAGEANAPHKLPEGILFRKGHYDVPDRLRRFSPFAALPLARTLLTGRGGGSGVIFLHRLYRDMAYIAAAVVAIIGFEMALTISLQNYWFRKLDQLTVIGWHSGFVPESSLRFWSAICGLT
jgi:hypothetical protein